MQGSAGEHNSAAHRRPIGLAAELRKDEIATVEILVGIDRAVDAAMLLADIRVVAVALEMATDPAVIAGKDMATHARSLELKEALDGRQQLADCLVVDGFPQLRGAMRKSLRRFIRWSTTCTVFASTSTRKPETCPPILS
jgi:hypothetical protein